MDEDYKYETLYGKKDQNQSTGKRDQTLAALLNAVSRDLSGKKTSSNSQLNQLTQPTQSTQFTQPNQPNQPSQPSQPNQPTSQSFKKTDKVEDDEHLKKKHKVPKDQKDKQKSKTTDFGIDDDDSVEKMQQSVNDLPPLVPLASFASQVVSQNSNQTENQQSQMGMEQKKDEEKHLQEVINDLKGMKSDMENQTNQTTQPTQQKMSKNVEPEEKNIEKTNDSNTTSSVDLENKISSDNILSHSKMEKIKTSQANIETESLSEDVFTYDKLITNLKYLAYVEKGQKLSSSSGNLDADNMMFGSLTRWWYNEGKEQTHEILKKIIKSSEHHSELLIAQLNQLKDESQDVNKTEETKKKMEDVKRKLDSLTTDLSASKKGIRNLGITYQTNDVYLAKLDICLEVITVRIYKNMNF